MRDPEGAQHHDTEYLGGRPTTPTLDDRVDVVAGDDIVSVTELDKIVELRGVAGYDVTQVKLNISGVAGDFITTTPGTTGEILAGEGQMVWRIKLPQSTFSDGAETLSFTATNGTGSTTIDRVVTFATTAPTAAPRFGATGAQVTTLETTDSRPALTGYGAGANATVEIYDQATYTLIASGSPMPRVTGALPRAITPRF